MEEVAVGRFAEIADGDYKVFAVDEFEVGVFRIGDKLVAYRNWCPHAGGPVCQGKIFHQIEEALTLYARKYPEDAFGIEPVIRFRRLVGEEFERLVGRTSNAPGFPDYPQAG